MAAAFGAAHGGFPLGRPTLFLRSSDDRREQHASWWVGDEVGSQVALLVSRSAVATRVGRSPRTLHFQMIGPDGAPMLSVTRFAEPHHRLEVCDPAGVIIGQVRQTNASGQAFRTARMAIVLESGQRIFAGADLTIDPSRNRYADVRTPIRDAAGSVIATVERQGRYTGRADSSFVYKLDCLQPTGEPLPTLLLTTAFTYSLYDRLAGGGFLGAVGRWLSRPTWES